MYYYELGESFGDQLEILWTADRQHRLSLRDLAGFFNRQLLETAMTATDMSTVDSEIDNLYRLLTADDVSSGMRLEARTRLERNGIDIDQLERNFVSYQAIRSYLTEYRDAEYEGTSDADRIENVTNTIQRLRSRLHSVTEGSLEQLRDTKHLSLGEFRLFINIDVLCEDCGAQYDVLNLLERGGCDCDIDTQQPPE